MSQPVFGRWPGYREDDWCLFLDRDGVLNRRIEGDYVRSWDQFEWLAGALGACATLARWAPHIVVVTNQQGVGKGLMTQIELTDIHDQMRRQVMAADGRIDDVLVCSHLASLRCRCRKPRAGLPLGWLAGHPHVDPEKCVVVGDSWTDIAMGRMATSGRGATVWIGPGDQQEPVPAPDARFDSLRAFADFTVAVLAEKESA